MVDGYLPMLRLTVAPCPSDWASESSFFTTALGFSNGAAADDEVAEVEEDMIAGNKKTTVTPRARTRIRRSMSGVVVLALLVFLDARRTRLLRLLLSLVRRASAV
jgi:hypothetical protein